MEFIRKPGAPVIVSKNDTNLTLISPGFPPRVSGTGILMANLFSNYKGKVNAVGEYAPYAKYDPAFHPPCDTQYWSPNSLLYRVYVRLRRKFPDILWPGLKGRIRGILKNYGTNVVLAT